MFSAGTFKALLKPSLVVSTGCVDDTSSKFKEIKSLIEVISKFAAPDRNIFWRITNCRFRWGDLVGGQVEKPSNIYEDMKITYHI